MRLVVWLQWLRYNLPNKDYMAALELFRERKNTPLIIDFSLNITFLVADNSSWHFRKKEMCFTMFLHDQNGREFLYFSLSSFLNIIFHSSSVPDEQFIWFSWQNTIRSVDIQFYIVSINSTLQPTDGHYPLLFWATNKLSVVKS